VFGQPRYLAAAALSGGAFFAVLAFSSGMVAIGIWEPNPFADPVRIAANAVISLLFGANVAVLMHNAGLRAGGGDGTHMTTLGAFAALMTTSCPLCQPFSLLALGLGGIGALMAGLSTLISLASIGLLSVSLKNGLGAATGKCGIGRDTVNG